MKRKATIPLLITFVLALVATGQQAPKPQLVFGKEALQKRLIELEAQREQSIANVNAISGAIQECTYWLEQIRRSEEAVKEKEKPKDEKPKKES